MKGKKVKNKKMKEKICHESHVAWTSMVTHRGEKADRRDKTQGANAIQWKESKSLCLLIIYKNISTNRLTMSFILEVGYEGNFHLYRLAIACSLIKD